MSATPSPKKFAVRFAGILNCAGSWLLRKIIALAVARPRPQFSAAVRNRPLSWGEIHPWSWNVGCILLGIVIGVAVIWVVAGAERYFQLLDHQGASHGLQLRSLLRYRLAFWDRRSRFARKGLLATVVFASTVSTFMLLGEHSFHDHVQVGVSFPLSALNDAFYYGVSGARDGAVHTANLFRRYEPEYAVPGIPVPTWLQSSSLYLPPADLEELDSFFYHKALEHGKAFSRRSHPPLPAEDQGAQLRDIKYKYPATEGVGFNVSSYNSVTSSAISGIGFFADSILSGIVYANNVSVTCLDATFEYENRFIEFPTENFNRDYIQRMRQPSVEAYQRVNPETQCTSQKVRTAFWLLHKTESQQIHHSIQAFFFPSGMVAECVYSVSEYGRRVRVRKQGTPIEVARGIFGGWCLDGLYTYPPAAAINHLLSRNKTENTLTRAWRETGYHQGYSVIQVLESTLSETAQAYYSLLRQRVERANLILTEHQMADERGLRMYRGPIFSQIFFAVFSIFHWAMILEVYRVGMVSLLTIFSFTHFLGYRKVGGSTGVTGT